MSGPNIVALDQEQGGIVAVVNGSEPFQFHADELGCLPPGGGWVVADVNTWAVRQPLSLSQYCWESQAQRDHFVEELSALGYVARGISNQLANRLYRNAGMSACDAVRALARHVHTAVASDSGPGGLWCGTCGSHQRFDGGRTIRQGPDMTVDRSFGVRAEVSAAFLRIQSDLGYRCAFVDAAVTAVWEGLTPTQRDLMNLRRRTPTAVHPGRVAAVAVCTHDPSTGRLRIFEGRPWGVRFICRRVIGLNGQMTGTGPSAAGNPMRAMLRAVGLGRRSDLLAEMDRAVVAAIWALRGVPQLPRW